MAVSIQAGSINVWSGTLDSSSPYGHDISVTVASGTDSILVVTVGNPAGGSPVDDSMPATLTVTFDGVAMTKLGATPKGPNSGNAIFYTVAPSVGTYTVATNVSSWYGQQLAVTTAVYDGADQSTPFGTPDLLTNTSKSSPGSASITAGADDATLCVASLYGPPTAFTVASGQTELGSISDISSRSFRSSYQLGSSSSVGYTWTSGSNQFSMFSVLMNAAAVPDTTEPTLNSLVGTQTGSSTATIGATTDEDNGTMYGVVTESGTAPSVAQIQAGQDNSGSAAAWSGSQSISSIGAKTFSATGLAAETTYYGHIQHQDTATNDSTVETSSSFTTAAASSATTQGAGVARRNQFGVNSFGIKR